MLERLQSALKTMKDSKPPSLMSHRFVTVRRGSPAARSGQIQPGDQLQAVEGRAVASLQHRDLAQILRRAGNTLRISITPRHHSGGADLDLDGRLVKGSTGKSKEESRFYSVDLERGPTGFGFSLRGGSEYNMGLYVLGLMDGGPAQRSNKIQVSDQLVEINGDSTAGMTHSQAVEQIRRGGHRIHLVLKKGNGYVPDYGPEEGVLPPSSSSSPPEEQDSDMLAMKTTSLSRRTGGGAEGDRRRRGRKAKGEVEQRAGGGRGGVVPPDLDLDLVEEEWRRMEEEKKERRRQEEDEALRGRSKTVRPKKREDQMGEGGRSRGLPRTRAPSWDSLQLAPGVGESGSRRGGQRGEGRRSETRSTRRVTEEEGGDTEHAGSSSQRGAFSFLMPLDAHDERPSDSESAASFSEVSQSAASIATTGWREESHWMRANDLSLSWQQESTPGPWLTPSPRKLTQVLSGSRFGGRSPVGGLSL